MDFEDFEAALNALENSHEGGHGTQTEYVLIETGREALANARCIAGILDQSGWLDVERRKEVAMKAEEARNPQL